MQPTTVESGARLADRYRLEERLEAEDGFTTWRAVDEKLSRYVGVHILPADNPRAQAVVQAAQATAVLNDGRFSQVLDASQQGDVIYVVEERLRGTYLAELLRAGPLSPAEAASVTKEVATALASAHEAGLAHLCLGPENVLRTENGQIKIFGLSVEAALRGIEAKDPAVTDTRWLGALLYACLTAKWPGNAAHGLAAAPHEGPHEGGAVCSPAQVRAGVPAALDEIAMRALSEPSPSYGFPDGHGSPGGSSPPNPHGSPHHDPHHDPHHGRHHGRPLRTPAEVVAELASVPRMRRQAPDPGTRIGTPLPNPAMPGMPSLSRIPVAPPPGPSQSGRVVGGFVAVLVLAGVVLFALSVARNALGSGNNNDPFGGEAEQAPGVAARTPIKIDEVRDFDPPGKNSDGEEHGEQVRNVLDGDPDTSWTTRQYKEASLPPFKPGVGLVLDFGAPKAVRSIQVRLGGSGTTLELRAANDSATSIPGGLDDYVPITKRSGADGTVTLNARGTRTQFLLVWLTKLPNASDGNGFRGEITDITVRG